MYRFSLSCLMAVLFTVPVHGLWVPPDDSIPVARLVENLEKQLAEKPGDAHLLARLGRIHSLRYALGDQVVSVQKLGESADLELYEHGHSYPATRHDLPQEVLTERVGDLHRALDYYERAIAADPDEAYIWLGLGYVRDEMAHAAPYLAWPGKDTVGSMSIRDMVQFAWEEQALDAYAEALGDSPTLTSGFLTPPVELEAARYIIAILDGRDRVGRARKTLLGKARSLTSEAARLPRMVTPIIFSLEADRSFQSLLNPDCVVNFDLDGSEAGHRWTWLQPDTALLVWDADGRGDVPSGRQLIGSVTWWLFWEHGYAVLQALDNDNDGWLRGDELTGLAAWQDRNSNGVSDAGEVLPLGTMGIQGLATTITETLDGIPMNRLGIVFSDGRVLPSYDWIVSPVE